jgi:AraC-like DNA-binding protein
VDQVRVEMATEMLRVSDASLTEIAMHLGYSNQANFSRACQRWTGMKPSEVRGGGSDD